MDYFKNELKKWADWQAVMLNPVVFEPLIQQIYRSENEPFKTPEAVADRFAAVFAVGPTQIAIFPPVTVASDTRDHYQTERFSLRRLARLKVTAATLLHAGFIFDSEQFYYVIYRPLVGTSLTEFVKTAEPLAKSTLGRQLGLAVRQLNSEVAGFNQVDATTLANQADWAQLGSSFATDRESYLTAHPVPMTGYVHGQLTGENVVVTAGQVGFQHFQAAVQGPWQADLATLVGQAFAGDADLLSGFQTTFKSPDLAADVLIGLLWRPDGPTRIQALMGTKQVAFTTLTQRLQQLVKTESEG